MDVLFLSLKRFAPVVDRFASVVSSISAKQVHPEPDADRAPGPATVTFPSSEPGPSKTNDTFQYQRAYRLSLDLKDTLYVFTNEQIKQIQEHNILVYVPPSLRPFISISIPIRGSLLIVEC